MDFRVTVSLWSQAQGQAAATAPATPAPAGGDFRQRLGLDQEQGAPRQDDHAQAQPGQGEGPLADPQLPQGQLPDPGKPVHASAPVKVDPAAGLELYALGLQAGTRLSHVPAGLLASAEALYRANTTAAASDDTAAEAPRATTLAPAPAAAVPARGQGAPVPGTPARVIADQALARLNEGLGAWPGARWPQRNVLLLPRDDGVELLIRDHHLDAAEQATLLGELLRRLPGSGVDAQRIWINGHPVWQREPLSRLQGDA